jgi:ferredoxin--NADP+ reductase
MTYVITQSCCSDATCVLDCPVDCIRPTPGDPEFNSAEMLYIDPKSCIDCGACQEACPVSAVHPEEDVPDHLRHFTEFNAGYFRRSPLTASSDPTPRPERPSAENGPLTVAIVGSGPAAAYLAEDLLRRGNVKVNILEKLPTPWGLLRAGVAPDHLKTKDLAPSLERVLRSTSLEYYLKVEVGRDIAVEDLLTSHHAVVIATGAADPAPWDVPGADLAGVHPAADFVAWYNGHPEHSHLAFDLSADRAVVIGNGNVALDVARVLLLSPEELKRSDIAEHARIALENSNVKQVVVAGRRGPLQAAYTAAEFSALSRLAGVDLVINADDVLLDDASRAHLDSPRASYAEQLKVQLAIDASQNSAEHSQRRLILRYLAEPTRVHGETRVKAVEFLRNELHSEDGRIVARPTDAPSTVESAGLVITSIGYRGRELPGVPFDERSGTVLHANGRVTNNAGETVTGLYATGWVKRGPSGGIGAARGDAQETAAAVVADFNNGALGVGPSQELNAILAARQIVPLNVDNWRAIDEYERTTGSEAGRPRLKVVELEMLLQVAATR